MEEGKRRGGLAALLVGLLLLFACAFCLWQVLHRHQLEEQRHAQEEKARLERIAQLEERIAFLRSLLALPPCEAKARWKMP